MEQTYFQLKSPWSWKQGIIPQNSKYFPSEDVRDIQIWILQYLFIYLFSTTLYYWIMTKKKKKVNMEEKFTCQVNILIT